MGCVFFCPIYVLTFCLVSLHPSPRADPGDQLRDGAELGLLGGV